MSDDRNNLFSDLREIRKLRKRNRIVYWLLIAALVLASAGILVLTIQVMKL